MHRRILAQILQLDPQRDHQKIVFLSACYEFPFDMTRSLEFALFRTFCVSRIAALLDRTGEFQHPAQKRYDDTDIIISELIEWGYDSSRGHHVTVTALEHPATGVRVLESAAIACFD